MEPFEDSSPLLVSTNKKRRLNHIDRLELDNCNFSWLDQFEQKKLRGNKSPRDSNKRVAAIEASKEFKKQQYRINHPTRYRKYDYNEEEEEEEEEDDDDDDNNDENDDTNNNQDENDKWIYKIPKRAAAIEAKKVFKQQIKLHDSEDETDEENDHNLNNYSRKEKIGVKKSNTNNNNNDNNNNNNNDNNNKNDKNNNNNNKNSSISNINSKNNDSDSNEYNNSNNSNNNDEDESDEEFTYEERVEDIPSSPSQLVPKNITEEETKSPQQLPHRKDSSKEKVVNNNNNNFNNIEYINIKLEIFNSSNKLCKEIKLKIGKKTKFNRLMKSIIKLIGKNLSEFTYNDSPLNLNYKPSDITPMVDIMKNGQDSVVIIKGKIK
ncbi:hypothetical protein RB653_007734 [Dictyostelium firmibasis]|uniref:Uncharacterized protein n=1 Tax=Dictyostelium firmibasis TaxID=79012 RepID=A0AAN7YY26_9MYCE